MPDQRPDSAVAGGSGNGCGYGNGNGYGSGYGNGNGNGDGDGYGNGHGYGDGYGYGNGHGYGDGYGYGNGHGYGLGYGHGNGHGLRPRCGRYTPGVSKPGSVTIRHLLIAALVVAVVNAQLTWWIVFVIGQSRTVLDLERDRLMERCRREARHIEAAVARAEIAVEFLGTPLEWSASGARRPVFGPGGEPGSTLPPPFVRWAVAGGLEGRPGWHGEPESELRYEFECPRDQGLCGLIAAPEWARRLLDVGDGIELGAAGETGDDVRPSVALTGPLAGLSLRPPAEAWDEVLETYRRRIVMMASEGTFFAILLVVLVGLLWRTLRREIELERRHRNFLSAITHELKSPLAAIRLSLETVSAGRADESTSRRFIGNALTDTDRLERLVTKVLQATRYDSGSEVVRLREVDLTEVIGRALVDFESRASAAGAVVVSNLEGGIRAAAVDPEALVIAVSNLLENALTYGGRPARVRVDLRSESNRAVIDVTDNGAGIDAAELPFVFDRFYRVGDEMTRTGQGTGLGLYLVQRIVHAHQGTVLVAASGADGTTFRVTLPGVEVGEGRE